MTNTFHDKMSYYAVHKAKMANRKLARQNAEPASGTWMYKTSRASEETKLDDGQESVPSLLKSVARKPANAVQRRINGLAIPIDLGKHRDRQLFGYNYLEYLK